MRGMELDREKDLGFIFPIINGKVSMAINRILYRNFRKEGLEITPEQWTVLAFLWLEDGVTQQTLCNSTFKDKPSMTRLIDNLVKQKLVYRSTSEKDRRSNFIYLTDQGKEIKTKATRALQNTMDAALVGVDDARMLQVRIVMSTVFNNIKEVLDDR